MSFIEKALEYGYDPQQILQTIANANPEFAKRVQQAVQYGIAPAELLKSLGRSFQGSGGKKTARAMGINPKHAKNLAFSDQFDAAYTIPRAISPKARGETSPAQRGLELAAPAAAGAAAAYLAGPAMGAIAGRVGEALAGQYAGGDPSPEPEPFDALGYVEGMMSEEGLPTGRKMVDNLDPRDALRYLRGQVGAEGISRMRKETGQSPLDVMAQAKEQLRAQTPVEERPEQGPEITIEQEAEIREPSAMGTTDLGPMTEEMEELGSHLGEVTQSSLGQLSIDAGSKLFKSDSAEWRPVQERELRNPKRLSSANAAGFDYDWENKELSILYALQPGGARQKTLKPGERKKITEHIETSPHLDKKGQTAARKQALGTQQAYRMPMDNKTFIKMLSDEGIPITQGANAFGMWDPGKKGSYGAKLDKFVSKVFRKATPDQKIEVRDLGLTDMELVQDANVAWSAGRFLDGFDRLQRKNVAQEQIRNQDWNDLIDQYGSAEVEEAVIDVIQEFKVHPGKELMRKIDVEAEFEGTGKLGPAPYIPKKKSDLRKKNVDKRVRERLSERSTPKSQRRLEKKVRRIE